MDAKELAVLFHETYERLAPGFGYKTRKETREFSEHTSNGQLMIAVCGEILRHLSGKSSGCEMLDCRHYDDGICKYEGDECPHR